jgi:hypothetical protein
MQKVVAIRLHDLKDVFIRITFLKLLAAGLAL